MYTKCANVCVEEKGNCNEIEVQKTLPLIRM